MSNDPADIRVHIEGSLRLSSAELWPDGDAPNPLTADAVIERLIGDDQLRDELLDRITIDVLVDAPNPAWTQAESLLPGHAPAPRLRTEWSFEL